MELRQEGRSPLLHLNRKLIHALESAHALAEAFKRAAKLPKEHLMVVNLSGRGDKDMQTVMHHMSEQEKHA